MWPWHPALLRPGAEVPLVTPHTPLLHPAWPEFFTAGWAFRRVIAAGYRQGGGVPGRGGVGDEWPRDRFQWRQEVGSGAWAWVFVGPPPTERTPPNPLTLNQLASKRPWRCCISHIPPRTEIVHVPEVTFLALLWQRAGLGHLVVDQGAHGARAPPVRFVVDWDAALRVGGGWYNPGDEADYGGRVSVACRPNRTPPPNPNPNPYPDPNPPSPGGTMYSGGAAPPPGPPEAPPPVEPMALWRQAFGLIRQQTQQVEVCPLSPTPHVCPQCSKVSE